MGLFESLFDLAYLALVIGLGVRLLAIKDRNAKIFGVMSILLGLGDSFHLIPRVVAHFTENGFVNNIFALSYGQMITSITMTIFYLLYYYYYKAQSGQGSKVKAILVYALVAIRIGLVLMPQNRWGELNSDITWDIIRNIPFAILGLMLIIWSLKADKAPTLKKLALLIAVSFACYLPVVLFSDKVSAIGALMMPKTLAYLAMSYVVFKYYVPKFSTKSLADISLATLVLGLAGGVFYREFTKLYGYTGYTSLNKVHPHVLTLGFLALLITYLLVFVLIKNKIEINPKLQKSVYIWMAGLLITNLNFLLRGIFEVIGYSPSKAIVGAVAGIGGIGHILIAVGLVWGAAMLLSAMKTHTEQA